MIVMTLSGGSDDDSGTTTPNESAHLAGAVPSIFICGFVAKRWHNGSLNSIITELVPDYYVSANNDDGRFTLQTRMLLAHASVLVFFVNEYTLADKACLLSLQYAWSLMIPIIVLRPPRTKLVISARAKVRRSIMVDSHGVVVRSPSVNRSLQQHGSEEYPLPVDENDIDYSLLQDILYEGYRKAEVYDRLEHDLSMERIRARIERALHPFQIIAEDTGVEEDDDVSETLNDSRSSKRASDKLSTSSSSSHFKRPATPGRYGRSGISKSKSPIAPRSGEGSMLGASNTSSTASNGTAASTRMRISRSMGNLSDRRQQQQLPPVVTLGAPLRNGKDAANKRSPTCRFSRSPVAPIKVERHSESSEVSQQSPSINTSSSSPFDRRMSLMSLDDLSHYTSTQYLVFPIHDTTKKPVLVRFPSDLIDESTKRQDDQWGSDSDLAEEAEIAPAINGDIGMLDESDSPIASPAPYNDSLTV